MAFTPTEEQLTIISAAQSTTDNLLISALAGAAKTSTLVLLAEALPDTRMLCLAFNKRIADEMTSRLPSNCTESTLNSLGHRVWGDSIGRRVQIDRDKGYNIMRDLIEDLAPEERKVLYPRMAELMRIVAFGKSCGYVPTDTYTGSGPNPHKAKRLMDDDEFFAHIEQELEPEEQDLVRAATLQSLKLAFEGRCDYDDQILMPTVFHGSFPRFPLVLVDEAQDLSALNHAMLKKIALTRLIAVGDQCQAIYGFRGAHKDSMSELSSAFSMTELPLSISFRCPKAVVRAVKWRAPNMRWPEWAAEGSVTDAVSWDAQSLAESAAVICRNNAPLFACAIKLLKNGRNCELAGRDVVKSITNIMRKFGSSDLPQMQVLDAIDRWQETELAKNKKRAEGSIRDCAECMRIFANEGIDLGAALAYAQHLTYLSSPLKLMTGHKAKGLEFDHVYFLDEELVGHDGQDPNLRYVILTRAKQTMTYIRMEDFHDTHS